MKKITEENMKIVIYNFNKTWFDNNQKKVDVIWELNNVFMEIYGKTKIDYMFKIDRYSCLIVGNFISPINHIDRLKIYFHRVLVRRNNRKKETKFIPDFSHELKFYSFCYRYCNPDIIHIFEKILFNSI